MAKPPALKVIEGAPAPDSLRERSRQRRRAQEKPEHLLRCPRCTGIAVLAVRIGMTWRGGKPIGGQKQLICETCHMGGERVVLG